MDEAYIRKRVSQIYAQSWGGGMINKFTALIIELLNEQDAQQSVQADDACAMCGRCHRDHVIMNLGHYFAVSHRR